MSDLSDKYQIRHLKDDTYQLVMQYNGYVVEQGSYADILAYIQLEEMGLL